MFGDILYDKSYNFKNLGSKLLFWCLRCISFCIHVFSQNTEASLDFTTVFVCMNVRNYTEPH